MNPSMLSRSKTCLFEYQSLKSSTASSEVGWVNASIRAFGIYLSFDSGFRNRFLGLLAGRGLEDLDAPGASVDANQVTILEHSGADPGVDHAGEPELARDDRPVAHGAADVGDECGCGEEEGRP